ncbi:MAG: GNAT family N-acetyltransferase [Candidatus Methanomethylicia archaeon]
MISVDEAINNVINEAISSCERRLIAVSGSSSLDVARRIVELYTSNSRGDVSGLLMSVNASETYRSWLEKPIVNFNATAIDYAKTVEVIGGTWNILVLDVSIQFSPSDIGRLVEVVSGGGLVIFTLPPISEWISKPTLFQKWLIVPPYSEKELRHIFKRRFINTVINSEGTWLLDLEKNEAIGKPRNTKTEVNVKPEAEGICKLALTSDQVNVIRECEKAFKDEGRKTVVILANRGRGKSAAIGLALADIVSKGIVKRVVITSPEPTGASTLYRFLKNGLSFLNVRYVEEKKKILDTIRIGDVKIVYMRPDLASRVRADVKIVDEAASIPIPLLYRIIGSARFSMFASTVHGYEGTGRSFTLRFLKGLKEIKNLSVKELTMTTPIRYPVNDPIEKWLYSFLLLNAEPPEISLDTVRKRNTYYVHLDINRLFEDEEMLKGFYGIYVMAHYRNRPDDLAILADAPHHSARALMMNGKVIVSIQLAEEGGLSEQLIEEYMKEGVKLSGHMIPHRLAVYNGLKSFPKLKGLRIVRIATHPKLWGEGFGSKTLRELTLEAEAKGYDWIGAGFGATRDLIRFWTRNNFIPVHLSPVRNPTTGEFSILVVKPLTRRAQKQLIVASREFKLRFLNSLHNIYFDLNPYLILDVLNIGFSKPILRFTKAQLNRLEGYVKGSLSYEASADAVLEITKAYFMDDNIEKPKINEDIKALMIAKVIQGKKWHLIRKIIKIDKPLDKLREAVGELIQYYGGRKSIKV